MILCVGFGLSNETFRSSKNLFNLTSQMAINALLSAGLTYVIILGGIDISVGSVAALAGVISCIAGLKYNDYFQSMNTLEGIVIIIVSAIVVGGCAGCSTES